MSKSFKSQHESPSSWDLRDGHYPVKTTRTNTGDPKVLQSFLRLSKWLSPFGCPSAPAGPLAYFPGQLGSSLSRFQGMPRYSFVVTIKSSRSLALRASDTRVALSPPELESVFIGIVYFFLDGGALSLWFACRLQSTIINHLSLSLSFSPTPRLSLSPSHSLLHSFSIGIRSFRDCFMSGWKGISDCFAFFPSSLCYIVPDIMSFFSRIGKIKAYLSGPSSWKSGFLRLKFALPGLT